MPAVGTEVVGRFHQAPVEFFQGRIDRQNHERQEAVDQPDADREVVVEQGDATGLGQQRVEALGDPAVFTQDDQPRVVADQQVGPERDGDQQHHQVAPTGCQARHPQRHRKTEQEAQDRGATGLEHRTKQRLGVDPVQFQFAIETFLEKQLHVALQLPVGLPVDAAIDVARQQADVAHDAQRNGDQGQQGQDHRAEQQRAVEGWGSAADAHLRPPSTGRRGAAG
ncbi:hypothetical protein D3C87_1127770 [compost metagenome]